MSDTDLDRYLSDALKRLYPLGQRPADVAAYGPTLRQAAVRAQGFRTRVIASAAVGCIVAGLAVGAVYLRSEQGAPSAASSLAQRTTPATPASWATPCMPSRTDVAPMYLGETVQQAKTAALKSHARVVVVGRNGSCVPNVEIPAVAGLFLYVAVNDSSIIVAAASNDVAAMATPTR